MTPNNRISKDRHLKIIITTYMFQKSEESISMLTRDKEDGNDYLTTEQKLSKMNQIKEKNKT